MPKYPAALAEVGAEHFRRKLQTGIYTGYGSVLALLALTFVAKELRAIDRADWAVSLIAAKFFTNTLAWIALRRRVLVIELSALNITADVVLMTGAVYFTGGAYSPLASLYFVEVAVMALLTNVGLTLATVVGAFGCFAAMVAAVELGALPRIPSIGSTAPTSMHVAFMLAYVACVMLAPGAYVALIVQRLRENERALERRARELVDATRARAEFTANVTHELRTPLHGILGMGELLEDGVYGPMTEKQSNAVRSIRGSATGLLELIDSLLVLARQESLKLEVRRAPVDLVEVVHAIAATGRMLVGTRALAIELDVEQGIEATVSSDRPKLVQILVNLVANAVKFTDDGGSVTIALRREGPAFVVRVSDTGRGISPEDLPRIFEPYFQADGSAIREHGGAGIGLSVVDALSKLLGITVAAQSALGRGSTFTVTLPRE
jgi:signal transduction histidine kinase